MNIIDLETPINTEKYYAPKTDKEHPFYITEYGKTLPYAPCYQLRMESPIASIQYVISGSGIIICNDSFYAVNAGDTFFLPEGSNQIYYSNPDNKFERIWLNFKGELARSLVDVYKLGGTVVYRGLDTYSLIAHIQDKCLSSTDPEEYEEKTSRPFLELIQLLAKNREQKNEVPETVGRIRLYIDCHATENIKISDIAKKFSFSKEHIIRLFKKSYGITPHQYIIQSKIRIAMMMLKMTDINIEEISEKLSFSDPHHFSAQFQKYIGYRPSLYRKKFKV